MLTRFVVACTVGTLAVASVPLARAEWRGPSRSPVRAAAAVPVDPAAPPPSPASVVTEAPPVTAAPAAPPRRRPVEGPREVFVVGDSLTVGATPWLGAALGAQGWRLTGVDARVGRGVGEGLSVLRAHARDLPGTVVVALGTNNLGADPGTVGDWLRTARSIVGPRRLVWVNLCLDDRRAPRLAAFRGINTSLARLAAGYGVELADWCAFASERGIRNAGDGIHYATPAYQQRAAFYAQALTAAG